MSRSSIFSSESCDFRPRDPAWKAAIAAVAIALSIVTIGEVATRFALRDVGRRWEYWHLIAATKFEFVRDAAEHGNPIRTLVVGDSTGDADIDPAILERELGSPAWNVAWSGNFALAFEQTTLPLLEDERLRMKYVIASFIPTGFGGGDQPTTSEAGLLSSTYVRTRNTIVTGEYVFLARLRSAWPFLINNLTGRRESESVRRFGFAGNRGQATSDMIANEPLQPPVAALNERRLGVLRRLAEVMRRRRVLLVVVIPPSLTNSAARIEAARLLKQVLLEEEAKGGVRFLDLTRADYLDIAAFANVNHLNTAGAALLTTHVAKAITSWSEPSRQHPTHSAVLAP